MNLEALAKPGIRAELSAELGAKKVEVGGHCWQDKGSEDLINARYEYYATKRNHARWRIVQEELMPELRHEVGTLTPKLVKLVHILEWVRIAITGVCRKPYNPSPPSCSIHAS
jgi:hypothetical protein